MSDNLPEKASPKVPDHITPEDLAIGAAVKEQIINDLQTALELIQSYQRTLKILSSPDPDTVKARKLLHKYKMISEESSPNYKIYLDGRDITNHPDSIEASSTEEEQLQIEAGDE